MSNRTPNPLLIDTDAGVDDALAILYALHSPEVRVQAITTVAGNVEVEKCTRNVRTILGYAGLDLVPEVAQGAARPLRMPLTTAPEVHGKDGLGNTQHALPRMTRRRSESAVECIRRHCDQFSHRLTIVALGPLTNIALTLKKYPQSLRKVRRIVSMGGAFRVPGNTGPVAEFNYFVDPHAANAVLRSGLPLTIVPLDVTEQILLLRTDLRAVVRHHRTRMAAFILRFTGNYMRYHKETVGVHGAYLHDPLAMAIAIRPTLAHYQRVRVEVECKSELTRGMTVGDLRKKSIRPEPTVAVGIDRRKFLQLFHDRVLNS